MEVLFWWIIGRMMDGVGNIVGIESFLVIIESL